MPDVHAAKPPKTARFWEGVLDAEYPMVELVRRLPSKERARRDLALEIVQAPERVAEAFSRTVAAIDGYAVEAPFLVRGEGKPEPTVHEGQLRVIHDLSLRLKPPGKLTPVDSASVPGVGHGDLDLVYLERDPTLTRTAKADRPEDLVEPAAKLKTDLLLAAPDGTIGVGEVTIGDDRDLFSALIRALAGLALIATPAQIRRVFANYVTPQFGLPPGVAPKLDIVLLTVPRGGDRNARLTELDVLARGFVPALLAQSCIAAIVRQVTGIRAALAGEELALTGRWIERPALG
ncbi:MAG: hypothetical protein AAGC46_14245 [Solirubrobacteraceae bacterium]|nr:hypothetical protein [Patulibacter sp.]